MAQRICGMRDSAFATVGGGGGGSMGKQQGEAAIMKKKNGGMWKTRADVTHPTAPNALNVAEDMQGVTADRQQTICRCTLRAVPPARLPVDSTPEPVVTQRAKPTGCWSASVPGQCGCNITGAGMHLSGGDCGKRVCQWLTVLAGRRPWMGCQ